MSADNTLIIAKFPDWYRVTHAQAIENLWYYKEWTDKRKETIDDYFYWAPLFETKDLAMRKALDMEQEILDSDFPLLEYGIRYIGEFSHIPCQYTSRNRD